MAVTGHRIVYPDASEQIAGLLDGARRERLGALGTFRVHIGPPADRDEFVSRIGDATALVLGWDLPVDVMRAAPHLELVSFCGIGAGNFVDLHEASRRGITVCNTPGYADDTVAEHALALMLGVARHLRRLDFNLRAGNWEQELAGIELGGKTLGLVGFGGIAARLAHFANALGMRVLAWTRRPDAHRARRHSVEFVPLEALLEQCDVLSIHVALTPETEGLIDAAALARTRRGVIVVNTARGQILDEEALITALRSAHVAGAGLDVFANEPLPENHPLTRLDNVLLTPHVAYNTPEATAKLLDIAVDNIVHYANGSPINVLT